MTDSSRILVVGPSWVGDMVMAQSLFIALRQRSPEIPIDVLAPAWSRPLLERMPEVDEAIDMPLGHGQFGLRARWQLGRALRGRYDQAILLPNSWKSALVPFAAGIARRTGWLGEWRYGLLNDPRRLDKSILTMTVQRFVALADDVPVLQPPTITPPLLKVNVANAKAALDELGLEKRSKEPVLALCPGAEYGSAKRWPVEYYAALACKHRAAGGAVWLFGSSKDKEICSEIKGSVGEGCEDLAGRTSLAQAVDLMSLADAVVSNDSGLMHVAAALNRPLVAIYGSSDPGFTPPLNERNRIIDLGLDCSPCFKRECPLGHLRCLRDITVEQVAEAVKDVRGMQ